MDNHFFYQLAEKYIGGDATPDEQKLVEAFYEQLSSDDSDISDEMRQRVKAAMSLHIQAGVANDHTTVRKIWPRVAAAVAILIIATSAFFLIRRPLKTEISTHVLVKAVQDKAPGSAKAILTLAGGSTIILDSAHNGILAHQGNTSVIKTDSGRLAYSAQTEKAVAFSNNTLSTPRGGQFQLLLPDGTKVWLNAASSITYPTAFVGKERMVEVSGEVYFEVVHNKFKPFRVNVKGTNVDDIGTSFNINAYGDENNIKTTLLEGSVIITTTKGSQIIKPGQQALTEPGSSKIEIAKSVDIEKVMAWHNGKIILSNVSVQQIMREISRWYDMDIEYAGAIPNRQFYGSVRRDVKLSTILNALKDYGIETRIEGEKIIVNSN